MIIDTLVLSNNSESLVREPRFKIACVDRFLRYVKIDTRSCGASTTFPSTEGQWQLQRMLADELRDIGASDVELDANGYLFATIPANTDKQRVPVIGLLAHVDTTPDVSGTDIKPILHEDYQGQDIALPDAPGTVIRVSENPDLRDQIGHTVITGSGKTILGADDKAGIAEIVTAVEYLLAHPDIPHGDIRIGITPDQELAQGTRFFDVERFGAHRAYTLDGQGLGQLQTESFSADTLYLEFLGVSTHPGYAKGRLINAIKVASEFIRRLPRDGMSPETTAGYEGYAHPASVEGSAERARVAMLIRSFDDAGLENIERMVEGIARDVIARYPGAALNIDLEQSYRNMAAVLDSEREVVEYAEAAIRRAGLEVRREPLRGGTDGAQLCFKGLPTPNLFAGQHNFHATDEWVSTYDMEKAVEVIIELCREWEERAPA